MKTGRRKLGRIYAQPVEKREELVLRFFFFFFFSRKKIFCTVIVYFNACRFYTSRL